MPTCIGGAPFFSEAFHNKCGYCEVVITAADHLGDVEHYRPKAELQTKKAPWFLSMLRERKSIPAIFGSLINGTIYFRHVLHATSRAAENDGVKSGKWVVFSGRLAARAGDESNRNPMLLNPWRDDRVVFDFSTMISGFWEVKQNEEKRRFEFLD